MPWVPELQVDARLEAGGTLYLDYRLQGNLARVRVPSPLTPERINGLWRHTCFEAFVGREDVTDYLEYNFAPSGQWQAFTFRDYRQGCRLLHTEAPLIVCDRTGNALLVGVRLRLPATIQPATLRIGLCTVLEAVDGGLSYWALRHGGEAPDFHDRTTFVLTSKHL